MKIFVIFTGGTISCSAINGVLSPDDANSFLLLKMFRQNGGTADFFTAAPYQILSENLTLEHPEQLRRCIGENLTAGYDGIIVTHGTDTLQYTAAYLGYVFSKSDIPIVLVSANYPLADKRSNGLDNFTAAVDFIRAGGGKGVYAAYKNTGEPCAVLHRATRLLPHMPYDDKLLSLQGGCTSDKIDLSNGSLHETVLFVRPYVGVTYPAVTEKVRAILLEGWHSGTLPTAVPALKHFCAQARAAQVPVFLTGNTAGFDYESKSAFERLGIQVLPPASPIAMYIKLLLCENVSDVFKPCGEDFVIGENTNGF